MALHLARRKHRLHYNPSLIHLFSTSSSSPQDGNESGEHPSQSPSSSSSSPSDFKTASYFSGLKSSLKQNPQREDGKRHFARFDANAQNPAPSLFSNQFGGQIQDIRRNLNEFRSRAAAPPPRDWQDLYKQDVLSKSGDSHGNRKLEAEPYANIKQNLRQMRPQANTESKWANLSGLKTKFNENHRSNLFGGGGGGEGLPISVFGKELEEGKKNENESEEMKSELIRSYDTDELGEKLRLYRPQGKKEEGWFSLQELNQRLVKLREMEDEREQSTMINQPSIVKELRSELRKVKADEGNKVSKFDVWGILNGTPKYLLEPPKEQLVETYFHPDNMSSAEKMKIELAKVRDEFKMSESDCGSARVQVAQLTTKIKHLSSVLHKKDKHSRKGLIAMVQRRKKLLKYMRRTDWDSYCLSLSKLGLRDNPDYKF